MIGFGLIGLALMIGCFVATLLYIFVWDTSGHAKRNVIIFYIISTVMAFMPEPFHVTMTVGFVLQVLLCLYYAFYLKLEQL